MIIKDCLKKSIKMLNNNKITDATFKAKILLANCISKSKEYLLIHEDESISIDKEKDFFNKINKLCNNIPLQYLTKEQEFMGLKFYVDENVLVPRYDTEILVNEVIKYNNVEKNLNVLEMCTGSGIISVSLAKFCNNINITAVDISKSALFVAEKNARLNNVEDKITFLNSNMFNELDNNIKYDYIVSNPPYIESKEILNLDKDVQNEPIIALDGGADGLKFYKDIAENIGKFLKEGGYVFLEIGYNQKEKVFNLFKNFFEEIVCIKDFQNLDRVIICKKFKKGKK